MQEKSKGFRSKANCLKSTNIKEIKGAIKVTGKPIDSKPKEEILLTTQVKSLYTASDFPGAVERQKIAEV